MFNKSLVAIDIGSSSIKVVELTGQKQRKLRSIGLEMLPAGAIVDGMIQNQEAVEGVLTELLKKLKISTRGRRASLALSGSSVLIKKVGVVSKDTELSEQVYYEAEQHFQTDMSEIYFDYAQLGATASREGETPVLLVGAKREMVEQYIALVRSTGMRCGVIECGSFSVANMFEYNYGIVEGLAALVNVGSSVTQISLVHHGEYIYTRDIAVGGEEYSRRIMEQMSTDRANAESLKLGASQGGGSQHPDVQRILGETNDQLVNEVHLTIDYFLQSGEVQQGSGLTCLFLTGGGSRVLGLDAALAAALQVPVQLINPFQRIDVNPRKFQMEYLLLQGSLYGVALGLGLRAVGDNS